jgi:hypothetical protein
LVACSRCAVGRFLGCAVFPGAGLPKPVKVSSVPLVEFRLRLELWPTIPSRSHRSAGGSSHGLCAPSAHKGNGDPLDRGLCLPATVRPQGLATLSTAYALRTRAGFVSHRRRSWGLPFGAFPSRKVSSRFRRDEPTYRLARQYFRRRSVEPAQRASVSGFLPSRESLADRHGVSTPTVGCSLGFSLPRHSGGGLAGFSPALLSRAWLDRPKSTAPAPQSLNRPPLGRFRKPTKFTGSAGGNPLRVFAPVSVPVIRAR